MKIEALHIGLKVRHPQYGLGAVKSISERTAEIRFDDGVRTVAPDTADLEPAEAQASLTCLDLPLRQLIEQVTATVATQLGLEQPNQSVTQLGARWLNGRLVLHPADPTLTTKEIPVEVFFHKIVMIRNNLRNLEQKINAHTGLTEADKIEFQQYITRSYGSLTTFNLLFKDKNDQFSGVSAG